MSQNDAYAEWFAATFGTSVAAPGCVIATSWDPHQRWGKAAHTALLKIEVEYVEELIRDIRDRRVPGDFAEFGVFEGWWIGTLWTITEKLGLKRNVYGFDSFKGLSRPHPEFDGTFWKEGQYACDLESVRGKVRAKRRPRIHLIEGYFSESLPGAQARAIGNFCFARIDCDLYEPALECLRYLGPRLVDGAILVFDDWPHELGLGEQKAFADWLPEVPDLKFEFLFFNTWGHFYLRVHRA